MANRYYATREDVRVNFPTTTAEEITDRMIDGALKAAGAAINEAGRRGGYVVPFSYCPNTPELIQVIAEQFAAGWVLTRGSFSACTEEVPENGKTWLAWAEAQIALLAAGELSVDDGEKLEPGSGLGVLSSGVNGEGARERIKQFPFYSPPANGQDPSPIVHPQYGPAPFLRSVERGY